MNGWIIAFMLAAQALPKEHATELRPRVTVNGTIDLSASSRIHVEGAAEALIARRNSNAVRDAVVDAKEAWIEFGGARADIRAGYGRVAWGRLDEVQPSDVINPIDTARFLIDGRAEARLPVAFIRGRVFAAENVTIEGVLVPWFRRGRFDSLAESSSPFNLINDAVLPAGVVVTDVQHAAPSNAWRNVQGGGRVSATAGRVDVSVSAYRGFKTLGDVTFTPSQLVFTAQGPQTIGQLVERYPRFTMVAADAETVVGAWAIRGETAWFHDQSFDAGAGVDRKAGDFRIFGSVLVHRDVAVGGAPARTNTNLVGSIERSFGREHFRARAFAVVNPNDSSAFVRALAVWSASDRVAIDVTAAKFIGKGDDTISQFAGRDFVVVRARYFLR